MVLFVCTIIKMRLTITNENHRVMHTTKQSFQANEHATILSVLTHFDFDSVSSNMRLVYFEYSKVLPILSVV